jgi:hypothetical protein
MKTIPRITLILIISIMFSGGCATKEFTDCLSENPPYGFWAVQLTDNLPKNALKGYAEFYAKHGDSLGFQIPIYQIEGTEENLVGKACNCDGYTRRRVACIPGTNRFLIRHGPEIKQFDVSVKEGMVTPVRLISTELSRSVFLSGNAYTIKSNTQVGFRLEVKVEDPQPLAQHETQLDQYNSEKTQQRRAVTTPPRPVSISLTAQYPIGGVTFSVLQGDLTQMSEARELLYKAAKDLDLTKEPDKKEFLNRYEEERRKHPGLRNLLILCPAFQGEDSLQKL